MTPEPAAAPTPDPRLAGAPGAPGEPAAPKPGEPFLRSDAFLAVAEFHRAFGLAMAAEPVRDAPPELLQLRHRLLAEEVCEFEEAARERDLTAMADALADIVYIAYGSAVALGIDLDLVLSEVHRSNMSKLGPDGRVLLRRDGKVLKPETWSPPDVAGSIDRQRPLPWPRAE